MTTKEGDSLNYLKMTDSIPIPSQLEALPHERFHEVWWIFSPQSGDWGGLRIAHFHKTVNGVLIFMISDEPRERMGVRIWDDVSRREGWWKVSQIAVPTAKTVRDAKP